MGEALTEAMAKLYAPEMAGQLRVDRIWEGTSEIQRHVIANCLAKRGVAAHLA